MYLYRLKGPSALSCDRDSQTDIPCNCCLINEYVMANNWHLVIPEHSLVDWECNGNVEHPTAPAGHVLSPLQPGAPLGGVSRYWGLLHHHHAVVINCHSIAPGQSESNSAKSLSKAVGATTLTDNNKLSLKYVVKL